MKITAVGLVTAIPNVIVVILGSWLFGLILFVASLKMINPVPALTIEQGIAVDFMGKYVGAAMGLSFSAFLIGTSALLALATFFIAIAGVKWVSLRLKAKPA
jgi:membrane-bound acyltransferase YfiQ involved in biofilm formation